MDTPTVGIEEEFLLVEARTGQPVTDATPVLLAASGGADDGEFKAEFRVAMIETATRACFHLDAAGDQLRQRRRKLATAAAAGGLQVLASASHPTADPAAVPFTRGPRYDRIASVMGPLADQALVCGCHVHVAVPDRATGVAVLDRIRPWLALLLAVSTNSPMWRGRDTGYASWRAQAWNRLPTAGPSSTFGSLDAYDTVRQEVVASGAALDDGMIYFDARLSEHYPTVEVRVADVCLDVDDAVAVAGLARALVMTASDQLSAPAPAIPVEVLRAASWVASKHGVSATLLDPVQRRARPAHDVLAALYQHVHPALEESGDTELVTDGLVRLRQAGTGADHQRRAWNSGGPAAVLHAVAISN